MHSSVIKTKLSEELINCNNGRRANSASFYLSIQYHSYYLVFTLSPNKRPICDFSYTGFGNDLRIFKVQVFNKSDCFDEKTITAYLCKY